VRQAIVLTLSGFLCSHLGTAVTLEDYAKGQPLTVYTVKSGSKVPCGPGDQTNNFKEFDKVLLLSGKGLTGLDGISKLRVTVDGQVTALADVKRLQLFLNSNELRSLPAEFFTMQNVAFLYLYDNRLDAIPPEIARMKGLQGIYVTGNNISRIPPEVFTMTWLRKLQVSKNHLSELPAGIGNLMELMHLNLSNNAIEVLPDSIGRLMKLRVCDFSDNRIKRLPEAFGHVPIMHQLRVRNNPLTSLPAGFEQVPGSIDITGTKIALDSLSPALRSKIGTEKRNTLAKPDYK
jgi:Leucine-rich repeat (LRR) protein